MTYRHHRARFLVVSALLGVFSCQRVVSMDYRSADPVADARRAFAQDDYRVLGVRVHDSVVSPIDTNLPPLAVNIQLPNGPIRFLAIQTSPGAADRPSDDQLSYMKRYNTEIWTQLRALFAEHRRP